jgi:putative alpha-1,2-mannosidase
MILKLPWTAAAAAAVAFAQSATATISNPVDYVNILGGTNSRYDLSHGNTLPLIGTPWSFNTWSPMTTTGSSWYFHPYDVSFYGIRCTHQPRYPHLFSSV